MAFLAIHSARFATGYDGREYCIYHNRPSPGGPVGYNPSAPHLCRNCGRPPEVCCRHGSGASGFINGIPVRTATFLDIFTKWSHSIELEGLTIHTFLLTKHERRMRVNPEKAELMRKYHKNIEALQKRLRYNSPPSLRKVLYEKIAEWSELKSEIEQEAADQARRRSVSGEIT